jgi:hypothetical protein
LLFRSTRTGVRISQDGRTIETLSAADVAATFLKIPHGYCYIPGGDAAKNGTPVEYLDAVPQSIRCVQAEDASSAPAGE